MAGNNQSICDSEAENSLQTLIAMFDVWKETSRQVANFDEYNIWTDVSYDSDENVLVAQPDGSFGHVEEMQLLELQYLATEYELNVEITGYLSTTVIKARFVIDPTGRVSITPEYTVDGSDFARIWSIVETEYAILPLIEIIE